MTSVSPDEKSDILPLLTSADDGVALGGTNVASTLHDLPIISNRLFYTKFFILNELEKLIAGKLMTPVPLT